MHGHKELKTQGTEDNTGAGQHINTSLSLLDPTSQKAPSAEKGKC